MLTIVWFILLLKVSYYYTFFNLSLSIPKFPDFLQSLINITDPYAIAQQINSSIHYGSSDLIIYALRNYPKYH